MFSLSPCDWVESTAVIEDVLTPGVTWRVKCQGSYWKAIPLEPNASFVVSDTVRIEARKGNVLVIRAM